MKKTKKLTKTTKTEKEYHLLMYVEDCQSKIKKFNSTKKMGEFIDQFLKDNPDYASNLSDNWIDYTVTNITGDVHFFTDSMKVE